MNILIVTTEIGLNGGGLSLSCLKLRDILSFGNNVTILNSTNFPIATSKGGMNKLLESSIKKEFKLKSDSIAYKDTHIIIGFGGRYNGYYASLLAEKIQCRYILCLRGSDINITKWSFEDTWYLQESCRRASKIVCLSKEMVNNVISQCPKSNGKTFVIPNEITSSQNVFTFLNLPDTVVVGTAASYINEKKGISNLLYMIYEFVHSYKISIRLEIVGDVDEDLKLEYLKKISQLGIDSYVVFKEKVSREKLCEILSSWDFCIQGSVCEGHSNTIIEALQAGCGFISSKTGFIYEMLYDEFPYLFFKCWNPKDMAEDLFNLIHIDDKQKIYAQVFQHLQNVCCREKIIKQWESILSYNQSIPKSLGVEHIITVALHDVQGEVHDSITTPYNVFKQFVEFVFRCGFTLCSMKDYLQKCTDERENCIVCTFDDGYESIEHIVAPLLKQYNYTATVFICTGLIGKDNSWNNKDSRNRRHLNSEEIKSLLRYGWEIGSHGVDHKNLLKLSDPEIDFELFQSKKDIINIAGYAISYAYPYGAYNNFIQHCVEKHYKYAFASSQGGSSFMVDKMHLKRYSITEIYQMLL